MVYIPTDGSSTTRVMVHTHFGGSQTQQKHQMVSRKRLNLSLVVSFGDIIYESIFV